MPQLPVHFLQLSLAHLGIARLLNSLKVQLGLIDWDFKSLLGHLIFEHVIVFEQLRDFLELLSVFSCFLICKNLRYVLPGPIKDNNRNDDVSGLISKIIKARALSEAPSSRVSINIITEKRR